VRFLPAGAYDHTRGVAQQAARVARAAHLGRGPRARLLSAAWLHDLGPTLGSGLGPLTVARVVRRAGQEDLSRLLAHRSFTAMRARMIGLPAIDDEFPIPLGPLEDLLVALDIAVVTTAGTGARATPATVLRERVVRLGPADPGVVCLVAVVTRLGEISDARRILERVAPGG
jgi:hypothetical protein